MKKLQYKLIQLLLAISSLPLIIIAAVTIIFIADISINDARQRITGNLDIVQSVYSLINEKLKYIVRDENRRIFTLLENGQTDTLREELKKYVQKNKLDFFYITDTQGIVIISVVNPGSEGEYIGDDNYVRKAIEGEILVSMEILTDRQLKLLGINEQAKIPANKNTQGLVIKAALPIINREEKIVGTMSSGYLLNNNKIIIDEIKSATGLISSVFLDDLRISSNIPSKKGEYAVGSRLDSKEAKMAIKRGRNYIGHTSIMGKWYISGYTPLYNSDNQVIASIGISIPETYIFALRDKSIKLFGITVFLSIILALIFGLLRGGTFVNSIEKLRLGTEAVARGDFLHKVDINSKDEIEELANFFNKMTAQLKVFKEQLAEYSRDLENKVVEKTDELKETHEKLVQCERMAAMGRMATILGHELRNVFAGIQTITYNLKGALSKEHPKMQNPIKDLEFEINYANNLLSKVLRFSRSRQPILSEADLNFIVQDVITLLDLEAIAKNVKIIKNLDAALPKIKADGMQIREVASNIITNAVQAMPAGGTLTIFTKKDADSIRLEIQDTGSGISREAMDNLFTPFFTTKSRGLGLGLCIAKEVVDAHKGKIEVNTQMNKGTTFTVILPL